MSRTHSFKIVVAGCCGGPKENDLSGYLLSSRASSDYIALDAGTLLAGIEAAFERNLLDPSCFNHDPSLTPMGNFFLHHIKAYLISHAHLDHIAALVINSQVDIFPKAILGIDPTIDYLRDHIFNQKIWPNYGSEGENALSHYQYIRLKTGASISIPQTQFTVEAFPLSHPKEYLSTAFLIGSNGHYVVYFGDTSSDALEKNHRLEKVWTRIAPLLKERRLKGIFLECSYSMEDAKNVIYGHLDPKGMLEELTHLQDLSGVSLQGLPVIVTHRKESLYKGKAQKERVAKELSENDLLGIRWIFPSQGDCITL